MTTANIKITKVLLGRGNTAISSNYTGVMGEVTMDTTLKSLRVHDGVTVGGTRLATYSELANVALGNIDLSGYSTTANAAAQAVAINSLNANIGAFHTYANSTFGAGTYSNANVVSYLTAVAGNIVPAANVVYSLGSSTRQWKDLWVSNNTIYINSIPLSISANGALLINGAPVSGVGTYGDANVAAYLGSFYTYANVTYSTVANAAAAQSEINALRANITAANSAITSNYNVFVANAAAAHSEINALRANITAANSTMTSNAGVQATEINELRANIIAANTAISSLQTQTYSNTNVSAYLAGNVTVGNLTTGGFLTTDLQITDNYIQLRSGAANDEINIAPSGAAGAAYLQLPNDATASQFDTRLHNDLGNVEIGANAHSWSFGNNGDLILPTGGAINYANGVSILDGIGGTYSNTNVAAYLVDNPQSGTYSNVNVAAYLVDNPQPGTYGNVQVAEYLANFDGTINFTASPAIINAGEITAANISSTQGYFYGNGTSILAGVATQSAVNAYQTFANANAAAQSTAIDSINANTGAYQTWANTEIGAKAPAASPTFTGNVLAQGNVTVNNNLAVLGNLTVQGTTTTVNATTLTLTDKVITVANGSTTNNEANGAGLYVPGSAANILYTSIDDSWTLNKTISGTGNIKAAGWVLGTTFAYANGVNILSDLYSNAATQATAIDTLTANAAAQATSINTLDANAAAQAGSIATLTANAATQATSINNLDANVGAYQTFANANAATQATSISSINANIGAFQTFANANAAAQATSISTLTTNAATQQTSINTINANLGAYQAYANATFSVSSYGNANVAAYLPVHSGNLQAAYITTLGTYGNITGANVISANTFVFGANGVNILSAVTAVTANLVNGSNVVALLSNGNLLLPNNMNFMSSPAVSTTGIVFGDGKFQRTAYTGPDSVLVNGGYNAALDPAGNLTVPGSILPNTDNVFDLGSTTMRFRHLYVGPGTVYVGNAAIKTTVTGNLILPGVTRAVASSAFVEQVETTGDQSYSFATNPVIIDNAQFEQLSGGQVPTFTPATYLSSGIDADGYVRNITVDTAGSGYAGGVADLAEQNMWATEAADPINNFNINDWVQIPFRAETRAGESEYDFDTGGGTDTGDITFDGYNISSTANIVNITASDYAQLQSNSNYIWVDNSGVHIEVNEGGVFDFERVGGITRLKLPADGDIVDSTGTSVLGGGATTGNVVFDGDQLYVGGTGFLDLKNNANQVELGSNNVGPVIISTDEGTHRWEFGSDGTLTLPGAITVDTTYNSLVAEFDGGAGEYYLIISKTDWPTANVEIQAGDIISKATDPSTSLVVTGAVLDDGIYWLAPTGAEYIAGGTMSFNLSRPKPEWQFNANSTIILPAGGDILDSNGASVIGSSLTIITGNQVGYILTLTQDANSATPGIDDSATIDYVPTVTLDANDWIGSGTNDPETYATATFANGETRLIDGWNTDSYGTSGFLALDTPITIAGPDTWPIVITSYDYSAGNVTPGKAIVVDSNTWKFDTAGNLTFPDNTVQTTAYVPYVPVAPVAQDNLMLDGGGAATIYEVTVDYAEGGFSSTRYGVNTPSFNGGGAEATEPNYYTLDGGGA